MVDWGDDNEEKKRPTIGGPCNAVCNKAGWWRPAGPKSNVKGWPHASVGKKAAPSSSRKIIRFLCRCL